MVSLEQHAWPLDSNTHPILTLDLGCLTVAVLMGNEDLHAAVWQDRLYFSQERAFFRQLSLHALDAMQVQFCDRDETRRIPISLIRPVASLHQCNQVIRELWATAERAREHY